MSIHQLFFVASPTFIALLLIVFYIKGKAALKTFPEISTVNINFQERFCSGYSMQSWKTKMGGASNVLDIIITDDELWIKLPMIFAGIAKEFDLLHRINLRNIVNIHSKADGIVVDFIDPKGEHKQVFLQLKKPDEFVKIIQNKKSAQPYSGY